MAYPWKNMNVIPRANLEAWHMYEPAASGHEIIFDYSGNGRHIDTDPSDAPVLTENVIGGQPAWYFDGTGEALQSTSSATIVVKHHFVLASNDEATFGAYRGLVTGKTFAGGGPGLIGDSGGTKWNDPVLGGYTDWQYRKNGVLYAQNNMQAPMSGSFALMELSTAAAVGWAGIQLGNDRDFGGRKFKGHFVDSLVYSRVLTDMERFQIYRYFAMRYHVWQQNSAGLDVFPFVTNKPRSSDLDQERFVSEPYNGDPTVLVRGSNKRAFTLPFAARTQAEFEAAEVFHAAHRQPTPFVYRDCRFYPARDSECTITSSLREQGSEVTNRFNYAFDAAEVT